MCSHADLFWFHGFRRESVSLQPRGNTGHEAHGAGLGMGLGCASGGEVGALGRGFTRADPSSSVRTIISSSGEQFSGYCTPDGSSDVLPNAT